MKQAENSREKLVSIYNRLIYLVNSLKIGYKETELKQMFKLSEEARCIEKECLKLLKKSLDYSMDKLDDDDYANVIATIFLYILVLDKLATNREGYSRRRLLKARYYSNISVTFPCDGEQSLEGNIEQLNKIKSYVYNLPRK